MLRPCGWDLLTLGFNLGWFWWVILLANLQCQYIYVLSLRLVSFSREEYFSLLFWWYWLMFFGLVEESLRSLSIYCLNFFFKIDIWILTFLGVLQSKYPVSYILQRVEPPSSAGVSWTLVKLPLVREAIWGFNCFLNVQPVLLLFSLTFNST